MNANKRALVTNWVDPDDAPELDDAFFERADEFVGECLVRRGRPVGSGDKVSTAVRFDSEVIDAFKATVHARI